MTSETNFGVYFKPDWLKVFFHFELDQYGQLKKVFKSKFFFDSQVVLKSRFLDRLIQIFPDMNRSDIYWLFKQMRLCGSIEEMVGKRPKTILINKTKLVGFADSFEKGLLL